MGVRVQGKIPRLSVEQITTFFFGGGFLLGNVKSILLIFSNCVFLNFREGAFQMTWFFVATWFKVHLYQGELL